MGVQIPDGPGGMLMPGPGDVGVHIVLGEAHLPADLVGVDLPSADQVVDGGLADMEDVCHLLGGKGFVLGHWVPPRAYGSIIQKM